MEGEGKEGRRKRMRIWEGGGVGKEKRKEGTWGKEGQFVTFSVLIIYYDSCSRGPLNYDVISIIFRRTDVQNITITTSFIATNVEPVPGHDRILNSIIY